MLISNPHRIPISREGKYATNYQQLNSSQSVTLIFAWDGFAHICVDKIYDFDGREGLRSTRELRTSTKLGHASPIA